MNIEYLSKPDPITDNYISVYNRNFFSRKSYVDYFNNIFEEKLLNFWKFPMIKMDDKRYRIPNSIYITSTRHTTNVSVYEFDRFTIYIFGRKNIKKLYIIIPVEIDAFNSSVETYYVNRIYDIDDFDIDTFNVDSYIDKFIDIIFEYIKNPYKIDAKSWSLFRKNLKIKNNKDCLSNKLFDTIKSKLNSTSVTSIEQVLPGINVLWNGLDSERRQFARSRSSGINKKSKANEKSKAKRNKKKINKTKVDNDKNSIVNMSNDDLLNDIINNTSDNIIIKL